MNGTRRHDRARFAVALVTTLALSPRVAFGQASQQLAPVGGRTTLVGGTGLVFGRDSASSFLNPATAVRVDKNRLSFSVDFYYLSLIDSEKWYRPGAVDRDRFGDVPATGNDSVRAFDFDSLPGSLCFFFGVGDLPFLAREASKELRERQARLGICLASIQYSAFSFNAEDHSLRTTAGVNRQAHNFRQTFRRLSVGPTYAMHVDNQLAIGFALHASRSSHRSIMGSSATTYTVSGEPISSVLYNVSRGDSHELTATAGATYRISPRQTVALTLQSPSLHLFGSGGLNHQTSHRGAGFESSSSLIADGSFVTRTPARIAIGTGIETARGSVEINVAFHPSLGATYTADLEGQALDVDANGTRDVPRKVTLSTPALGVVNFGVGGELFTSPRLSLLGGVSTDKSIVRSGELTRDPYHYHPARMNRVALSFGVGSHGDGGELLIGAEMSYGWGERLTPNVYQLPNRLDAADQKLFGFLFVLAGSTSFKTFRRAVDDVKKVIDPKPAPAPPKKQP